MPRTSSAIARAWEVDGTTGIVRSSESICRRSCKPPRSRWSVCPVWTTTSRPVAWHSLRRIWRDESAGGLSLATALAAFRTHGADRRRARGPDRGPRTSSPTPNCSVTASPSRGPLSRWMRRCREMSREPHHRSPDVPSRSLCRFRGRARGWPRASGLQAAAREMGRSGIPATGGRTRRRPGCVRLRRTARGDRPGRAPRDRGGCPWSERPAETEPRGIRSDHGCLLGPAADRSFGARASSLGRGLGPRRRGTGPPARRPGRGDAFRARRRPR